jgi:hypothetical protein
MDDDVRRGQFLTATRYSGGASPGSFLACPPRKPRGREDIRHRRWCFNDGSARSAIEFSPLREERAGRGTPADAAGCTSKRFNTCGRRRPRVRDARPQGRDTGAHARERWRRAGEGERRGLGAVGNSRIVAYGARSPTRSAAEGHAHPGGFHLLKIPLPQTTKRRPRKPGTPLVHFTSPALPVPAPPSERLSSRGSG